MVTSKEKGRSFGVIMVNIFMFVSQQIVGFFFLLVFVLFLPI